MLVTCQRFGDLFLFGLVWQYSLVQTKYNKDRFKVMASYFSSYIHSYIGSAMKRELNFCNNYLFLLNFWYLFVCSMVHSLSRMAYAIHTCLTNGIGIFFRINHVIKYIAQLIQQPLLKLPILLKSVHFKKAVTRSSFLSKSVVIFVVVILKMTTLFERNEDRVTGFLK